MIRRWLLLTIAALLLCPGFARAQDPRVEAAKKEGKVVWYTSLVLPSAERVAKLFEAQYPGIKVEVHRTGGFAEVAVTVKVDFEGFDEGVVSASVGFEERAEHFVIKVLKFALLIEVEEQAVDAKMGEGVQFVFAKEPTSNFEGLFGFTM